MLRACVKCGRLTPNARCPDHPARNGSTRQWRKTRAAVTARDHNRCQQCGQPATGTNAHVDHIHPVDAGGTDAPANLRTLCAHCNLSKGATT